MSAQGNAPIIIKKKKIIAGGGHHGGAWKVAYADFVTAMMAFFMLMWLLNATTEKQRKGIADYFSPTIPLVRVSGGGDGSFGGTSVFSEDTLARNGQGASQRSPTSENRARGDVMGATSENAAAMRDAEEALLGRSGESMSSELAMRHILTRVTDEGLIVEVFDLPGEPLFDSETDRPTPIMEAISEMLAEVFSPYSNDLAINGYMQSFPVVLRENPVWRLSTKRAEKTRQLLEGAGFPKMRLQRVTGYADRKPAVRDALAVRNNRIEVILLRSRR